MGEGGSVGKRNPVSPTGVWQSRPGPEGRGWLKDREQRGVFGPESDRWGVPPGPGLCSGLRKADGADAEQTLADETN